jgi:tetratricopeptide (TPR) repeat protein
LGYRDLIRQLDRFETLSPAEEALSLAALRRDVEVGLETRPVEDVVADFTQSLTAWFHKEHWRQRRHQVVAYYRWLIETELRVGHQTQALELFHRARRLLTLEPTLEQGLAQAAADLGLTDLGAATLYIKFLRGPDQDGARRRQVLALLRRAIRIDLACPDDQLLPEHRRLNEELWNTREEVWCAGHRAVAAWRSGNPQGAWSIREAVVDLTEADADALTQLGLIAYLCRAWDDAVSLLEGARKLRPDNPGAERLYLAMARVNRLLSGGVELPSRDQLLAQLEEQLPVLTAAAEDVTAVDARCVQAAACAGLGRDVEALALFAGSPAQYLAWRYAVLELAAAERSGQTDVWLTGFGQRAAASGESAVVVPLVRAMLAVERGDWATVRSVALTITVKPPAESVRDPDPAAVAALLQAELDFTQPEPMAEAPRLPVSEERVSGAARAWLLRLRARWHTERGEFEPAAALLSQATHGLTPDHVWERAAAAQLALQDADPDAPGDLFEPLATGPTATPQDRLVWALWLCGHGDLGCARTVLAELENVFPESLELRLARAESELSDGGQAAVARQLLQASVGKATPSDLLFWAKPIRQLSFRPWQRHVPRAFWPWPGQLSPHRIGDMLHGARLMIRAQLVDQALAVIALVEQVLGPEQHLLHPPLGELFRAACLAEMQAGHWEPACELQTRAARCGAPDPQFAVQLAESLQAVEAIPPDAVLAWTPGRQLPTRTWSVVSIGPSCWAKPSRSGTGPRGIWRGLLAARGGTKRCSTGWPGSGSRWPRTMCCAGTAPGHWAASTALQPPSVQRSRPDRRRLSCAAGEAAPGRRPDLSRCRPTACP